MTAFSGRIFALILVLSAAACSSPEPSRNSTLPHRDELSPDSAMAFQPNPNSLSPADRFSEESNESGEVTITADESLRPIVQAEVDNFMGIYRHAIIHVQYLPGELAIHKMLTNDSIRLVVATRKLSQEEEALLWLRRIRARYAPWGRGGIVLLVHSNSPVKRLEDYQLRGILTGEIRDWSDLDPGLSNRRIVPVVDHQLSGVNAYLRDSLLEGADLTEGLFAAGSTPGVMDYVEQNPNAIGIIGLSWLSDFDDPGVMDRLKNLRILELQRTADATDCAFDREFFGPFQSYLAQRCYPLSRSIYSIMRESKVGLGTGFVSYVDSDKGQRIIHKSGLLAEHTIARLVRFPAKDGASDIIKPRSE